MAMYKRKGGKEYETYEMEKGHKTTMAPDHSPRKETLSKERMDKGSKGYSGSRMAKSFERVEKEPLYTRHKGRPSGCME